MTLSSQLHPDIRLLLLLSFLSVTFFCLFASLPNALIQNLEFTFLFSISEMYQCFIFFSHTKPTGALGVLFQEHEHVPTSQDDQISCSFVLFSSVQ